MKIMVQIQGEPSFILFFQCFHFFHFFFFFFLFPSMYPYIPLTTPPLPLPPARFFYTFFSPCVSFFVQLVQYKVVVMLEGTNVKYIHTKYYTNTYTTKYTYVESSNLSHLFILFFLSFFQKIHVYEYISHERVLTIFVFFSFVHKIPLAISASHAYLIYLHQIFSHFF